MIFGLKVDDLSTITIVVLGVITLVDRLHSWYTGPHKSQDRQIKSTEKVQVEQGEKINKLTSDFIQMKQTLDKIKDNHLVHLQEDVNLLKESNIEMRTDLKWIIDKLNGQK